jgi:hypothetical protein
VKDIGDVPHADLDDLLGHQRSGKFPGHRVHRAGAPFAQRCDARLAPQTRRQMADRERRQQHDREGQQVLGVADSERHHRRDEEIIESSDRHERQQHARPAPQPHRSEYHAQQIEHHQIRQRELVGGEHACDERNARTDRESETIGARRRTHVLLKRGERTRRLRLAFADASRDQCHVDIRRLPDDAFAHGSREIAPPALRR